MKDRGGRLAAARREVPPLTMIGGTTRSVPIRWSGSGYSGTEPERGSGLLRDWAEQFRLDCPEPWAPRLPLCLVAPLRLKMSMITLFDGMASAEFDGLPASASRRRVGAAGSGSGKRARTRPSCAEGRVAANGPQGRYAPLTRWPTAILDRRSLLRVGKAGRDGGMVSSVEHRDGNKGGGH